MHITIIGCGNMGNGLAKRLSSVNKLSLFDRNFVKAEIIETAGYGKAFRTLSEALFGSEMIILAIKPQNLKEAGDSIGKLMQKDQILVSLLAGTSMETLKHYFPHVRSVRMMPNLALIYGEGVIGLSCDENFSNEERESISKIFECLGKTYWFPESKIDALSALTGSAPAFIFVIIESMIDAGIAMGFSSIDAQNLVYQMLNGSLTLLQKSEKHPGELKWQITSPKGTTIAGLRTLEEHAVRAGIINTLLSTYERAIEINKH